MIMGFRGALVTITILALAVPTSVVGQADVSRAYSYQPDWARIAKHMVDTSLVLAPGERVIIHYDPERDPALIAALRTEIVRAGGIISGELTWPNETMGKYLDALNPAQRRSRAEIEMASYRELFAHSDVYLWIHFSNYEDLVPREFEHLIGDSKVRAIHSHWFEPDDSSERDTVRRMYERAILADPAEMDALLAPMETHLRGARVHLTSPAGTDLTFEIPADAPFHRNTGAATREKAAAARSVRDREEELPAGVLRTTAVMNANGKLVAGVFDSAAADGVVLTFRNGRIVKVEPHGSTGESFEKWYKTVTGDRDRISELVIGVNPYLTPIQPSGFMPYYGYGAGIVRIAIGDNWESGGSLRTSDAADKWLFVTDGTLTAGSVPIVRNGAIIR